MPNDIKKLLFIILAIVVAVQIFKNRGSDPYTYKGNEFSIRFPDGWAKAEERMPIGIMMISESGAPESVTYFSPTKDFLKDEYDAWITVVELKMHRSVWIDDEFAQIAGAIQQHFKVLDQGQFDFDGRKSRWVLYFDKPNNRMVMEFYVADFTQYFYKIRYVSIPKTFNNYRAAFEATKATFKFNRRQAPQF